MLKDYTRNQARLKGFIVEGYIVDEAFFFLYTCRRWIQNSTTLVEMRVIAIGLETHLSIFKSYCWYCAI